MSETSSPGDTTTDFTASVIPAGKYLVDTYEDWARAEGVPISTGRAVDLMAAETRAWARFDCRGAIVHVDGRCDFLTVFLHEIAPGRSAAPQRHVYDELILVLAGTGETEVETAGGTRIVPWGPGTLLGAPTNARYRHRNTGAVAARLAGFNDLRYLMNLYRSERFIFENPAVLDDGVRPLAMTPATEPQTGNQGSDPTVLGSGTIGADTVELPDGGRTTARRQMQGAHLLGLSGDGVTLSWRGGAEARAETRWRHGVVVGLPGMQFHRHASAGHAPARALDIQLGSARFPMSRSRRRHYGDESVYASGSAEVD